MCEDSQGFSTLKILATVKQWDVREKVRHGFSTLKILATVKRIYPWRRVRHGFSTLKILATVKLTLDSFFHTLVLVPLRF